jgi:hypothetical protein
MGKALRFIIASFVLFIALPFSVKAQEYESIALFKSTIELEQNTNIHIEEEIHYHFVDYKRGIYRSIPTNYKVSGIFTRPTKLDVDELYYYKEDAPSEKFNTFEKGYSLGYTDLKIGDPNLTITGDYVFVTTNYIGMLLVIVGMYQS